MLETLVVPSCRPADSRPRKPPFHSVLLRPSGDTKNAIWNSDSERRSFCEERFGLEMWIWNCDLVNYYKYWEVYIWSSLLILWLPKCAGMLVSVSPPLRPGSSRGPGVGSESRNFQCHPREKGWRLSPVPSDLISCVCTLKPQGEPWGGATSPCTSYPPSWSDSNMSPSGHISPQLCVTSVTSQVS